MKRTVWIILGIVVLLLVAGGSFFGGTVYGKSQAQGALVARRQGGFGGANGTGQGQPGANARAGGQGMFGQIDSIGDGSLVVKDNSGQQTQVKVTDTTLIQKLAAVKLTDLKAGDTVIVSGTKGTDGVITARSVQVAPPGRFGPGGPGATPAPTQ